MASGHRPVALPAPVSPPLMAQLPAQLPWLLPWLSLLWPLWLSRRPEAGSPLWRRRSLLVLLVLLCLRYLHWRISASLNLDGPAATALSLSLLAAEAWLLLSGLLPLLLAWRRFDDGSAAADRAEAAWRRSAWRPHVDVLVPTCGEPLPVLERCLLGCSGLSYPHRTIWVLDEAGRPEVAALAARFGCRWHHRSERCHAKAGNLNAGLPLGSGELVAVFDADFIPQHHFLERTIGLLADPAVALVQTPQSFINADPLMRNLALERWLLPDEESFYRWVEPVRSAWGAVVCAGTSFLVRRRALEQVGGFVAGAIAEDFVTGIALASRGWRLRYLGEKLSAGLAAESMLDFLRQRQRWAAGTLQALRLPQGPQRAPGLSAGQRLAYLEGAFHWLAALPRLVLLLMPLSLGLLGISPIRLSEAALLEFLLPLWLALLLSVGWLNRGSRQALLADLPGWSLAVPLAATVFTSLWGRVQPFRITPKHRVHQRGGIAPALALPLLVLSGLHGLNLLALARGLVGQVWSPLTALGLLWGALTLLGLLTAWRACWDPPRPDPTPWLALELPARLEASGPDGQPLSRPVRITALSERGAVLAPAQAGPPGWREARLVLEPTAADFPHPLAVISGGGPAGMPRLLWAPGQPQALEALQRWLFCRPGAWPMRTAPPEWRALAALLARLLSLPRARQPAPLSLVPQQPGPPPDTPEPGRRSDTPPASAS
ncbi:MAG: hypothetical protein RLZZ589_1390 [Cyanobacteriota bacterium]